MHVTISADPCELGGVIYEPNMLGTKGPRKMTVLLPKLDSSGERPVAVKGTGAVDGTLITQ
jgi:hypothetical protein